MNLKLLIKNVKNYIKMSAKCESFMEIFDVENNSVIFDIQTLEDLREGVSASPDGEYLFSDGMKVTIKGGIVTLVEKPASEEPIVEEQIVEEIPMDIKEETIEETIEKPIVEEEVVEEAPVEEVVEEVVEETKEEPVVEESTEDKDAKIAELEAIIADLTQKIEVLSEDINKKDKEIEEAKEDLADIKNFYIEVNNAKNSSRTDISNNEGVSFSFNGRRK